MGVSEGTNLTSYVVLVASADRGMDWHIFRPSVAATSAEAAIRQSLEKPPGTGTVTMVAVPARSWKPMRVEQVQTVQTVITAADADPDISPVPEETLAPEDES